MNKLLWTLDGVNGSKKKVKDNLLFIVLNFKKTARHKIFENSIFIFFENKREYCSYNKFLQQIRFWRNSSKTTAEKSLTFYEKKVACSFFIKNKAKNRFFAVVVVMFVHMNKKKTEKPQWTQETEQNETQYKTTDSKKFLIFCSFNNGGKNGILGLPGLKVQVFFSL